MIKNIKHQESIQCHKCPLIFHNSEEWECHLKEKHKIIIYKCNLCEFTTYLKKFFTSHLLGKHNLENNKRSNKNPKSKIKTKPKHKSKKFPPQLKKKCKHCDFTSETRESLKMHLFDIHNYKQLQCKSCNFRTFSRQFHNCDVVSFGTCTTLL